MSGLVSRALGKMPTAARGTRALRPYKPLLYRGVFLVMEEGMIYVEWRVVRGKAGDCLVDIRQMGPGTEASLLRQAGFCLYVAGGEPA